MGPTKMGPLDGANPGTRYFSLARYAFLEALRVINIEAGHRVLLPSFVCRDLLSPVAVQGATPVWYDVNPDLTPAEPPENWPDAEVVVAIDYFGFAQDLAPFRAYAEKTGAVIIEDNAHGFLSRDIHGAWLGTRAAFGLFSIRKTLRIPDGAALWVNDPPWQAALDAQLPCDSDGIYPAQALKSRLRRVSLIGEALFRIAVGLARSIRKLRTGRVGVDPDPASERFLPAGPHPWSGLSIALANCVPEDEIARRRAAYIECAEVAASVGAVPVWQSLPANCAPYAFAFRAGHEASERLRRVAARRGFDMVTWPDLPDAIAAKAPPHYHNIQLINFLW